MAYLNINKPMTSKFRLITKTTFITISLLFICIFHAKAEQPARNYVSYGSHGAVSCGNPLAANAAINILKNGGNAVDAAVAAGFTLGVVDFTNSGLGGEGFALICNSDGKAIAIDGSTKRPVGQVKNQYDCPISLPAIPEMLLKMQRLYGKIPLSTIISPAIELSNNGFEVSEYIAGIISNRLHNIKDMAARELLAPNGIPLKANQLLKQPKLAQTLRTLAKDNGVSFYYGEQADKTLADMRSKGAFYTKYDFMNYRSKLCKPISLALNDKVILGNPFPSCSPVTIKLTEELVLQNISAFPKTEAEYLKIAGIYRKHLNRKYYDSARFINNSQSYLSEAFEEYASEASDANDSNTTHLCVWDKDNLVVSMTLTLGNHFGSGQLAPGGFFYANNLRTYSSKIVSYPKFYPKDAGSITSKSPIIVTKDNKPWLAIGGAGADRIITNTATVLANVLRGYDISECLQYPRIFMDYYLDLYIEGSPEQKSRIEIDIKKAKAVYKPYLDDYFGLLSAIQKENNILKAVGDKRRDGSCESY